MDSVMDMRKPIVAIAFTICLSCHATVAANCQQRGQSTGGGEIVDTLLGAALCGLIGSQIGSGTGTKIAIGAGVLAGGLFGNKVGAQMGCRDQAYHQHTTQNALETQRIGTTTSWTNPDSGHSGTVTPTLTWRAQDGRYCREYEQTVYIDGRAERATGIACREADGTWRMQNS